jgi:peptidoglycan/xylan/chitin deacetylase (PgdA/CDA1 family)
MSARSQPLAAPRHVVLTYHAHHVVGDDYARNDHVALRRDLPLVSECAGRIVPLAHIVAALDRQHPRSEAEHDGLCVALTFDDGPAYDVQPFNHPAFGAQPGFLAVMREFARTAAGRAQPALCATSFVIASPDARLVMESSYDPDYTFLDAGAMTDGWWNDALDTGLIGIANHSWDHLHPALPHVAHSEQARGDFTRVRTQADADAQIAQAQRYIMARTQGRASPYFAYPFGHANAYLAERYFATCEGHGIDAAFTVEPRPVDVGDSRFRIPRYVCGHDWRAPEALAALLLGAVADA